MFAAYIFDQDGTLYSGTELPLEISRLTKEWIKNVFDLTNNQVEKIYRELPLSHPNPIDGLSSIGLSISDYHRNVFDLIDPEKYLSKDQRLIQILSKLAGRKFVVTLASKKYSYRLQKVLGIREIIEETCSISDFYPSTCKSAAYLHIASTLDSDPKNILVLGNNFYVDVKPALENGFSAALIGSAGASAYGVASLGSIYELPEFLALFRQDS